jgi:ACS family D-galactonate transporter-like MFS transporter
MATEPDMGADAGGAHRGRWRWQGYHSVWLWLFLAWMLLYIDRSVTGPVVSWMIENQVSFLADAPMPHALGGIIGSMFFAGYMLTQFPAGYLGDRYGSKVLVVISLTWSALATFLSGLAHSLNGFVATRILTGLGEGAYYSNDRALVKLVTPPRKLSMGMGVVFVGLAVGLTVATLVTPRLLDLSASYIGPDQAWTVPFLLFSLPTLAMALIVWKRVRVRTSERAYVRAGGRLLLYSLVFLTVLMSTFLVTLRLGLGSVFQAIVVLMVALVLVALIYWRIGEADAPVLRDRNLLLVYLSAIPILYNLWFFGFWALLIVSETSHLGLASAAVYAALFGVASAIGYPLGGVLGDRVRRSGSGCKWSYVWMSLGVAVLVLLIGGLLVTGSEDLFLLGGLIFLMGVLFSAAQTLNMTLAADLAPAARTASVFGMWNLVGEIGAVLSPVISGALRDMTGSWTLAIVLDAALILGSAALVALVRIDVRKAKNPTS